MGQLVNQHSFVLTGLAVLGAAWFVLRRRGAWLRRGVVGGLEAEYEGRAAVLRADIQSDAGGELARRFAIDSVPSFVVLDPSGDVVERLEGTTSAPIPELRRALRRAGA